MSSNDNFSNMRSNVRVLISDSEVENPQNSQLDAHSPIFNATNVNYIQGNNNSPINMSNIPQEILEAAQTTTDKHGKRHFDDSALSQGRKKLEQRALGDKIDP